MSDIRTNNRFPTHEEIQKHTHQIHLRCGELDNRDINDCFAVEAVDDRAPKSPSLPFQKRLPQVQCPCTRSDK
jgi:hypothetical protein